MTELSKEYFKPKQKMTRTIHIKMTKQEYDYLKFRSKKLDLSMSEIIRESLFLYLNNHF